MDCYTWYGGNITKGLGLTEDDRLGQVVFLGETGRGRRYEKVALARREPADVVDGRVFEAYPVKITLPPKEGKPEKSFYILAKPRNQSDARVLVRVSTRWCYTKNSCGRWDVISGEPELLISGYGAHGIAGRIGNWSDGLFVMKPGDILKVRPEGGHKTKPWSLWIDERGIPQTASWQDWENLQAVKEAEARLAEAQEKPDTLDIAFGQMLAYTYVGRGEIKAGIVVSDGSTGKVVALGEIGRGRRLAEVPIIATEPGQSVEAASVVVLSEEEVRTSSWSNETTTKRIYGLTDSEKPSNGAILIRVQLPRPHRQYLETSALRGEPHRLEYGVYASGAAGRAGHVDDSLWVLQSDEAVVIGRGYGEHYRVIENIDGKPATTSWEAWEIADGLKNPQSYVEKGKAPWGHVPADWVGKVVQVQRRVEEYDSRKRETYYDLRQTHEGELISINPFVLNLGWDGRDYQEVTVSCATWVILTQQEVKRLAGEEQQARDSAKAENARLISEAQTIVSSNHFSCFSVAMREKVQRVAEGKDSWGDSALEFELMETADIERWNQNSVDTLAAANEATATARDLCEKQARGEILVEFGGHFRRMGNSGNGDYWVISSDGSQREPDEVSYRKRYTSEGNKQWQLVGDDELALSWDCGTMHDIDGSSSFTVAKLPVGGPTKEQLKAVEEIEAEIGASPNAFGLNPELLKEQEARMEAIHQAVRNSRLITGNLDSLEYAKVCGNWGQGISEYDNEIQWRRIRQGGGTWGSCENRDAEIVHTERAGDGTLQFLVYEKWGTTNLNIRWVEGVPEEPEPQTNGSLADSLQALRAKFNGK